MAVEASELGTAVASMPELSLLGMFMGADWVVKAVMVSLLLASFWSWAIIFAKIVRFNLVSQKTDQFEQRFWSSAAVDRFYEEVKSRATHPIALIFVVAMQEWLRGGDRRMRQASNTLRTGVCDRVAQLMQVTRNRELEKLEHGLGFLATVGSTAPFVGLFGTVWGIMNSFQSIAHAKNTSLAIVAPGIAEALLATAIGLFAAIPAVVAYNKLSYALDKITGRLEDFSVEFHTLLLRQAETERT